MGAFETGPKPLNRDDLESVKVHLAMCRVFPRVDHARNAQVYFSSDGSFLVKDRSWFDDWTMPTDSMWSKELMQHDPRTQIMETTSRGELHVLDQQRRPVHVISAKDIRRVDRHFTEFTTVGRSGFLLREMYGFGGRFRISAEEMEQILLKAEQGVKPEGFSPEQFMKVEPRFAGQRVTAVYFETIAGRNPHDVDGVAIAQNNVLLPREITHPLAEENWK